MTELVEEAYQARDYQRVVQLLLDTPRSTLLKFPRLGFMLADAGRRVGGVPDLLELVTGVVDGARSLSDPTLFCDALNLHGVLLLERGHAQAAERAWCELVVVATQSDSAQHVARASNNLGVAAILSMRLDDAIVSFQRAVTAYLRIGYSRGLAQSHQNLAIVFREMGHSEEAHAHFQRAMTFAYTADCLDDVARAEEEMALLLVYNHDDLKDAAALAQQALQRFTQLAQPSGIAQALRVIGIVALATGSLEEAERSLHAALALASERKLRLLEGEILLALATLARRKNTTSHAKALEDQARMIFEETFAAPWGEQVQMRMNSLAQSAV